MAGTPAESRDKIISGPGVGGAFNIGQNVRIPYAARAENRKTAINVRFLTAKRVLARISIRVAAPVVGNKSNKWGEKNQLLSVVVDDST